MGQHCVADEFRDRLVAAKMALAEAHRKIKQLLSLECGEASGCIWFQFSAGYVSQADGHGTNEQVKTDDVTYPCLVEGGKNFGTEDVEQTCHVWRHFDVG